MVGKLVLNTKKSRDLHVFKLTTILEHAKIIRVSENTWGPSWVKNMLFNKENHTHLNMSRFSVREVTSPTFI